MDRYDQEERRYDRDEPGGADPHAPGGAGEFPWEETTGTDQPPQVWTEPPAATGPAGAGTATGSQTGAGDSPGNGMAVAGFVLALVSLIPIPFFNIICSILAVTFSSIGLSRANTQGRPRRGLAIAGLCISLGALVLIILFFILLGIGLSAN